MSCRTSSLAASDLEEERRRGRKEMGSDGGWSSRERSVQLDMRDADDENDSFGGSFFVSWAHACMHVIKRNKI